MIGLAHINSPAQIKRIMSENGLVFHKGLGQNFLFDEHYLNSIINSGEITKDDTVIEIGPGLGVLTTRIAEKANKVYAIEIDSKIAAVLKNLTFEYDNIEIINQDVLQFDLNVITSKHSSVKIIANLPYYITTPIVMKILEQTSDIKSIVIMIQKEVAQRLTAEANTKDYGAITLAVNYHADASVKFTVPANAFVPAPKVESAVVRLDVLDKKRVEVLDEKLFFKIIKAAFGQRRKTLVNALSNNCPELDKNLIKQALSTLGISETIRGEALDINAFSDICNFFAKNKGKTEII